MDEAIVRIGDSEYTDEYSENDSNNAICEALSTSGVLEFVVEILMRFDEVLVDRWLWTLLLASTLDISTGDGRADSCLSAVGLSSPNSIAVRFMSLER